MPTITDGYARTRRCWRRQPSPYVGLTVYNGKECDRPVTQSSRFPLDVSPHTGTDGLVQDDLPPHLRNFWPFSPALPVTLVHSHGRCKNGSCSSSDRWWLSSPVPRGDHLPLRAARFFLLCVSLEVFATPTRRYHGRMLIHPSSPARATPPRCLHTRKFGTLASPPPPVCGPLWGPHSPLRPQKCQVNQFWPNTNFFFYLMIVQTRAWNFIHLLCLFVCQFATSFHACFGMYFHVSGPHYSFRVRFFPS